MPRKQLKTQRECSINNDAATLFNLTLLRVLSIEQRTAREISEISFATPFRWKLNNENKAALN